MRFRFDEIMNRRKKKKEVGNQTVLVVADDGP